MYTIRRNECVINVIGLIGMSVQEESGRAFFSLSLFVLMMIRRAQSYICQHLNH